MKFLEEFRAFLKEYKVLSLAVAFIMGAAINDLAKSFVDNIFMPLLDPLIRDGTWETAVLKIGGISISWGIVLNSLIYFVILSAVVFILIKKLLPRTKKIIPRVKGIKKIIYKNNIKNKK